MSPRIMMVSARRLQHSPMFGQLALSHTVWRRSSFTMFLTSKKVGLVGRGTRIHSGCRRFGALSATTGRCTRSDIAHAIPLPGGNVQRRSALGSCMTTHPSVVPAQADDQAADADVVAAVVGGDRAAFAILVRRHNQRMFR